MITGRGDGGLLPGWSAPGGDECLDVDPTFPSGLTGSARCSMVADARRFELRVVGTRTSYTYQPEAYARSVRPDAGA